MYTYALKACSREYLLFKEFFKKEYSVMSMLYKRELCILGAPPCPDFCIVAISNPSPRPAALGAPLPSAVKKASWAAAVVDVNAEVFDVHWLVMGIIISEHHPKLRRFVVAPAGQVPPNVVRLQEAADGTTRHFDRRSATSPRRTDAGNPSGPDRLRAHLSDEVF